MLKIPAVDRNKEVEYESCRTGRFYFYRVSGEEFSYAKDLCFFVTFFYPDYSTSIHTPQFMISFTAKTREGVLLEKIPRAFVEPSKFVYRDAGIDVEWEAVEEVFFDLTNE